MASKKSLSDAAESAQHPDMVPTEPSQSDSHFRFLDLPAELRNRIYFFACRCDEDRKHNLSKFKTPTIAQVSVQLRSEALAIFSSECSFYVFITTNVRDAHQSRIGSNYWSPTSHQKKAGTLGVKKCIGDMIRRSGNAALFRDVTFHIYASSEPVYMEQLAAWQISGLILNANKKEGSARVQPGGYSTRGRSILICGYSQDDVDGLVGKMKTTAEEILARDGFNGFRLQDLRQIARALRFVVPRDERVARDSAS